MQKQVKIHGLKFNKPFGILNVHELEFDPKQRIYVIKGAAGQGKTTEMTGLQTAVQGSKTLVDKNKYGENPIDIEVPLTDGDLKFYVSCKRGKGNLKHTLFTKDENGKKHSKLTIGGVSVSPAEYLNSFQTALTWRMNELVSENPTVQKKILLTMYQTGLKKVGVVFDKKDSKYKDSILYKIDKAEESRDMMDMLRKQKGGISEDLKAIGIDTSRKETYPSENPIEPIEKKIKALETEKIQKETNSEGQRNIELANIKTEAQTLITDSVNYNSTLKADYDVKVKDFDSFRIKTQEIKKTLTEIKEKYDYLFKLKCVDGDGSTFINHIEIEWPKEVTNPQKPNYIPFSPDGKKVITNHNDNEELEEKLNSLSDEAKLIVNKINSKKIEYSKKVQEPKKFDPTEINEKIKVLEENKVLAKKNNEKVDAVNSFLKWQESDILVRELKKEYIKLLAGVETGVEGLHIVPENDYIFLMYDGSYNLNYFHPREKTKKLQKLSAYSTSQRPLICMLIQNQLLSEMDKVMRYIFIDNIPIDKATKAMIEKMAIELDLHIFLNMTGDFDKDMLKDGEILIEGGDVFFK